MSVVSAMSAFSSVSLGLFAVCAILEYRVQNRIRDILLRRHPVTLHAVERSSYNPSRGLTRFLQNGGHGILQDRELDAHVRTLKRFWVGGMIVWVGTSLAIFCLMSG